MYIALAEDIFGYASNWALANPSEITTYTAGNGLSLSGANEFCNEWQLYW